MFNLTLSSQFGSTGRLILHTYWLSMLWSIDSCQNRVSADQYQPTVSRAQVSTHRGRIFFEVIRWQLTTFQMIAGSSVFFKNFYKYVVFKSPWPSTIKILTSNLPRTRKFSQLFKNTGWEDLFLPWSGVGHALRPIWCSDWSKFDRWVHAENLCSILKLVYFDSWSWQSFVSTCDVFNCLFPCTGCTKWNTAAIKSLLLFIDSLFIGFLVERSVACQSWKSDFGWHCFRFSPCSMRKEYSKFSSDSRVTW